jgi:hypothetical protein
LSVLKELREGGTFFGVENARDPFVGIYFFYGPSFDDGHGLTTGLLSADAVTFFLVDSGDSEVEGGLDSGVRRSSEKRCHPEGGWGILYRCKKTCERKKRTSPEAP